MVWWSERFLFARDDFFARAEGHKAQSLGKSCHLTVLLLNLDEEIEDMCLDRLRGTDLTGDT
jgi:hypothetical protein